MYIPATTLRQTGLKAQAKNLIAQQPMKYSMAGGDGLKSAAAAVKGSSYRHTNNVAVVNASRAAAARATGGFLECRYVECHRSVIPARRKKGATTCGKPNCAKNT